MDFFKLMKMRIILYNDNIGYIGSNSQFACIIFRDGYATVDEEQGKVFIVNKGLSEISQQNLKNYGNSYSKRICGAMW